MNKKLGNLITCSALFIPISMLCIPSIKIESKQQLTITRPITNQAIYIIAEPTATPAPTTDIKIESMSVDSEPIEYDPPETVYDWFSKNEVKMIERLVEAEATAGTIKDKMDVANVIYNRYLSKDFPNTIEGVIFQKTGGRYQFSCIPDKRYYSVKISKETVDAVEKAFMIKDTTNGALFFCNKRDVKSLRTQSWFESLTYIMTDKIGHSYYK